MSTLDQIVSPHVRASLDQQCAQMADVLDQLVASARESVDVEGVADTAVIMYSFMVNSGLDVNRARSLAAFAIARLAALPEVK